MKRVMCMLFVSLAASMALADQTPERFPTTCANLFFGDAAVPWTNPSFGQSSDSQYTTAFSGSQLATYSLACTGYNFSVPIGSTITGIVANLKRNGTGGTGVFDDHFYLIKGGTPSGLDRVFVTAWGADATVAHGGAADLWGISLTAEDVNAATFGVGVSAALSAGSTGAIDSVSITVYYVPPLYTVTPTNTSVPAITSTPTPVPTPVLTPTRLPTWTGGTPPRCGEALH